MSSVPPILDGTISAKPFAAPITGGIRGSTAPCQGTISGDSSESPEASAVAELGSLISSLGSLSAQAQSLPLSPPTLPSLPQNQGYRPQTTDYTQFGEDAN
jgi:hypothetical protein